MAYVAATAVTREAATVRAIRRYLATLAPGVYYEKRWGGPYGVAGAPDLSLCVRGRRVELEVKTDVGRTTPLQEAELEKWRRAGALVGVVRSVEEVRSIVERITTDPAWDGEP